MLLVGMSWIQAQGGAVPSTAVTTGFTPREFLYSCRGIIENGVHIGKVPARDSREVPSSSAAGSAR